MNRISTRNIFWLLILVACLSIIPFLGLADFHTKGEPREAVVAYSMLESGDWILPRNNGGEIPYKPPFFHWGIAAVASVTGIPVNEFASRLPSAIALISMVAGGFWFYARRKGRHVGLIAALVALTAFELHRAGANCRVDMVLTALTVGSLYLLYRWWERGLRGIPWLAILLMSCGTLTKGPVGSLIPCLTFGVFLLLRGMNFFQAFWRLALCGLASFLLPLGWYVAAYLHGGQEFIDLVMEENFGRMTNTMSYDSCVNPWYYNFLTLASGYLPWILLVIFSLFGLSYRCVRIEPKTLWQRTIAWVRNCDPVDMFSLVSIVVIFLFYCFPQSKRSVYLMPIYPFIAYFLARYMLYLVGKSSRAIKVYGSVLAGACVVLFATFMLIRLGCIPETIFHGKHAEQNIEMMKAVGEIGGWSWVAVLLPVLVALGWFVYLRRNRGAYGVGLLYGVIAVTFGLYLSLDGAYQPAVLNVKSQRIIAQEIDEIAPASSGVIYEYIQAGEEALGDPVHFFEINFYLGDRIENFLKQQPSEGYLLIIDVDAATNLPRFEAMGYRFTHLYDSPRPVLRQTAQLYRFSKSAESE